MNLPSPTTPEPLSRIDSRRPRVCVYCASRMGKNPAYRDAAAAVGAWIGREGGSLVYGGAQVGLMGVVADAALAHGAHVTGVLPRALQAREVGHRGLQELIVVDTMHERKQLMAERSDVFIALPGGIGTMEELFEVWTWRQLGFHDQPIGLLNIHGNYDLLWQYLQRMASDGFIDPAQLDLVSIDTQPERLLETLRSRLRRSPSLPDDYTRI